MIKFNAALANCWIEQEALEAVRAGRLVRYENMPSQLFIEFEGTDTGICGLMGVTALPDWQGRDITVANGMVNVIGKVMGFNTEIIENGYRYREPWGQLIEVPTKYRVTYCAMVEKLLIREEGVIE